VDDESWAIPCIIQLRNTCNIEKDSNLNLNQDLKQNLKTENKNRKEEKGRKALPGYLDLAKPTQPTNQPIDTAQTPAQREPVYPFVKKNNEELVLIPSSRLEATSTSWTASPRAGALSFIGVVTRRVLAAYKSLR
jgi:hypothetical protein